MIIIYIGFTLLGGFYMNDFPKWISYLRYASPIFHLYILCIYSLFYNHGPMYLYLLFCWLICRCDCLKNKFCINYKINEQVPVEDILNSVGNHLPIYANVAIILGIVLFTYLITFFLLMWSITRPSISLFGDKFLNFSTLFTKKYKSTPA